MWQPAWQTRSPKGVMTKWRKLPTKPCLNWPSWTLRSWLRLSLRGFGFFLIEQRDSFAARGPRALPRSWR
jgi:hypothetical protein